MKTTIHIPDDLYRRIKAQAALAGRSVREVTIELYRHWLGEGPSVPSGASAAEEWTEEWQRLGASLLQRAPEGPTATEILAAERGRLDRL